MCAFIPSSGWPLLAVLISMVRLPVSVLIFGRGDDGWRMHISTDIPFMSTVNSSAAWPPVQSFPNMSRAFIYLKMLNEVEKYGTYEQQYV
jgi:hypothetical protein